MTCIIINDVLYLNHQQHGATWPHTLEESVMDWQAVLAIKLDAIGLNPTDAQVEALVAWSLDNVPQSHWRAVAPWLPGSACDQLLQRASECCI